MNTESYHTPALLKEAIGGLNVKAEEKYIDCTLGGMGHSLEILKRGGEVLAFDVDPEAIENAKKNLSNLSKGTNLKLARGNFKDLEKIAKENGFEKVSGILFDLGVSTHQLLKEERGFSFNTDAVLDMRMDPNLTVTAKDLINGLQKEELYELFTKLGEEHNAWGISRAIVRARTVKPIETGRELAEIIGGARGKVHPATNVFQALRIAVNDELNNLREALPQTLELLEKDGRLTILSFHSLEDRIVKNFFKENEEKGIFKIITKKPITPSEKEILLNPRARSAKLRIAEKNC